MSFLSATGLSLEPGYGETYWISTNDQTFEQGVMSEPYEYSSVSSGQLLTGPSGEVNSLDVSDDGEYITIVTNNDRARTYELSTPYDFATSTEISNVDISSNINNCYAATYNDDGTKFYIGDYSAGLYLYNLSTVWDFGSATYDSQLLSFNGGVMGMGWNDDGTRVYVCESNNQTFTYELSTPFDVTTGSLIETEILINDGGEAAGGVVWKPGGNEFYCPHFRESAGGSNIYEFEASSEFSISNPTLLNTYSSEFDSWQNSRSFTISGPVKYL